MEKGVEFTVQSEESGGQVVDKESDGRVIVANSISCAVKRKEPCCTRTTATLPDEPSVVSPRILLLVRHGDYFYQAPTAEGKVLTPCGKLQALGIDSKK